MSGGATADEARPVVLRLAAFDAEYFEGSLAEARTSTAKAIELLKHEFAGSHEIKAKLLHHYYMSMYLVDVASGLEDEAYLSYVRSRYWYAENTIARSASAEELRKELHELTEERFLQKVLARDAELTQGKGAAFARSQGLYEEH